MSVEFGNEQSSMFPAYDFRTTPITTKATRAIYVAPSTNAIMTVHNEVTDSDVSIPVGGEYHMVRTKTAVVLAGYTVIYFYDA